MSNTGQATALKLNRRDAVDNQMIGHCLEVRHGDGIAEHIVRPGQRCRGLDR